jgi:hypothetical protein
VPGGEVSTRSLDDAARELLRVLAAADPDYADAFNAVIDTGERASDDARTGTIETLLAELGASGPFAIGELAVASGALVEQGGSPLAGLDALLDAIAIAGETLAPHGEQLDLDRGEAGRGLAADVRGWAQAFRRLVVGAMARLARSVPARARFRGHARAVAAVRALDEHAPAWHVTYLVEVLDLLDDAPLLLVETEPAKVTRMRVTGIRNGAHLIMLLEGNDALSTSRGYYTWHYFRAGERAIDIIQTMIPVDFRAIDLPIFEGARVVVRTPTGVHRSWSESFVSPIHDALGATITIEAELPDPAAICARMKRG